MARTKAEKSLIRDFVQFLEVLEGVSLPDISWPDEEERTKKEIDALVSGAGSRVAIELSSIDSYPDQREQSVRFMQVLYPLEAELSVITNQSISVVVPPDAIPTGMDWMVLQSVLGKWLFKELPQLPVGHGYHDVPGIPFRAFVLKSDSGPPGVRFSRFAPDESAMMLQTRLEKLVIAKTNKLNQHREKGCRAVLLVETCDIACVNTGMIWSAIAESVRIQPVLSLYEIWQADTSCAAFDSGRRQYWRLWPHTTEQEWDEMRELNHSRTKEVQQCA